MTDEELVAVLRWRGSALQEGAFPAAADRIEQLTAEREAFEQDNHRWKMECENFWRDRERILTAERDRLRAALRGLARTGPHWLKLTVANLSARAALKGETP